MEYYITNKGILEKREDGNYKIPNRRGQIQASLVKVYCDTNHPYFKTDEGIVKLDIARLIVETAMHIALHSTEEFKYTDISGHPIPHPTQGLEEAILPEEEQEEITFVDEEVDEEKEDSSEQVEKFLLVLDTERINSFAEADKWMSKLEGIYKEIKDTDGKDTISYEVNRRIEKYRTSIPELSEKTLSKIESMTYNDRNGMRGKAIVSRADDLRKQKEQIDAITPRNKWELEKKLRLQEQWLEDYDKLNAEAKEMEQSTTDRIEQLILTECPLYFKAEALERLSFL